MPDPGFRYTTRVQFAVCHHQRDYEAPIPAIGDEVTCYECNDARVVEEYPELFGVICQKKACRFARKHRQTLESAQKTARSHVATRPAHTVYVYKGNKPVWFVDALDSGDLFLGHGMTSVTHTDLRKLD